MLVGAGDIATCTSTADDSTAALLDSIPGTVFTTGDNAYPDGTPDNFTACYAPSWGRHKARTRPAPGNHDYHPPRAAPYFSYFGAAAGESGLGYYSYDLGAWHIVSLNSNIATASGSDQERWLRADLARHPARCTLAYWHHPRFSSGPHGSARKLEDLWQALYDAGADVALAGHDHLYERFAPQDPAGRPDSARGIREFVVGTGGAGLYDFEASEPNSEARQNGEHGVLKLTLHEDGYDWQFIAANRRVGDAGSGRCH